VTDVPESSKTIGVEDSNGKGYGLNLDATVLLKIPGISQPAVTDIKKDDMVKATYIGNDLQEVDVMPVYRGAITNINPTTQQFTIQKMDGTVITVPFASGDIVKYDNTQTASLSALSVGDRVQVQANANGYNEIYKMKVISDQVNTVDNLYIYLLNNMQGYRYSPYVYTHQGVYNIGISSLQKNDSVTLYLLNDTVYEINKAN
jgi:hypothetical protein